MIFLSLLFGYSKLICVTCNVSFQLLTSPVVSTLNFIVSFKYKLVKYKYAHLIQNGCSQQVGLSIKRKQAYRLLLSTIGAYCTKDHIFPDYHDNYGRDQNDKPHPPNIFI